MIVRIYKTGYIFHALSIIIIAVIIWLPHFLVPQTIIKTDSSSLLYETISKLFEDYYFVNLSVSFLLVVVGGLLINSSVIASEISGKTSLLGFFFFVLLNSSISTNILMSQFWLSSFFILLMVNALLKIPKGIDTIPITFNASFFLGLATLFYYPSLLLIISIWVALMVFTVSSWREYVVAIIGVLLPLFFSFSWYFYIDKHELFLEKFFSSFHFNFAFSPMPIMDLIVAILILGMIVPSLFKLVGSLLEKSIVLRQRLTFVIWLFALLFLIIIFFEKSPVTWVMLSVPATIVLVNVLSEIKKLKWVDLYISLLFILVLLNHYFVFF